MNYFSVWSLGIRTRLLLLQIIFISTPWRKTFKMVENGSHLTFPKGKKKHSYMEKMSSFLCWGKKQPFSDISLWCGAWKSERMDELSWKNPDNIRRRQRLEKGERKCNVEEVEDKLVHWNYDKRNKMLHVSTKMIMWKAKSIFD